MSILMSIVDVTAGCEGEGSISYKSKYLLVLFLPRAPWPLLYRVTSSSSAGPLHLLRGRRFGDECLTTVLPIGLSTSLATGSCAAGSGLLQDRGRLVEPEGLGLDMMWVEVRSKGVRGEVRVVGGMG